MSYKITSMENFTQEDSLRLINKMIANAKTKFSKSDSYYFLFWGYFSLLVFAVHYFLAAVYGYPTAHYAWLLFPVGSVANIFLARKIQSQKIVTTKIDKVISQLWISFAIGAAVAFVGSWFVQFLVMPILLLLIGITLFANGLFVNFNAFKIGGLVCLVGALIGLYLGNTVQQLPLYGVCIIAGYIIPGHLLKKAGEE